MTQRSNTYLKGISETGDQANQTLFEDLIDTFTPFESGGLGTFAPGSDININVSGEWSDHTMTGNETWNFANLISGKVQWVKLTTDGSHTLTIGTNGEVLSGSAGQLQAGSYKIGMAVIFGAVQIVIPGTGTTPGYVLALSNFSIEDAQPTRVYFDTNQAPIGTTFAGFTLATPSKTITGITFNSGQQTGHYFTVSVAYSVGDISPTIAYDGSDDWTGTGGALASFTATAITNNIGLSQLTAPTLGTVTPASGQVTIAVTNPNSGNETQNQLYYKLSTEPTTWTTGQVMATSGTSVTQTGLTNGLTYNFRMIAEGDGVTYSDSDYSNTVNGAPSTFSTSKSISFASASSQYIESVAGSTVRDYCIETDHSWSIWIKPNASSNIMMPLGYGVTSQQNYDMLLWNSDHGTIPNTIWFRIFTNTTGSAYKRIQSVATITRGAWNHIAVTYNYSTEDLKIYFNGVEDTSATIGSASYTGPQGYNATHKFFLGKDPEVDQWYLDGFADEISQTKSELSSAQVTSIYNSGVPTDLTSFSPVSWIRGEDDYSESGSIGVTLTNNGTTFSTDVPS